MSESLTRCYYNEMLLSIHTANAPVPVRWYAARHFAVEMYSTLLPRMNASPYLFFS